MQHATELEWPSKSRALVRAEAHYTEALTAHDAAQAIRPLPEDTGLPESGPKVKAHRAEMAQKQAAAAKAFREANEAYNDALDGWLNSTFRPAFGAEHDKRTLRARELAREILALFEPLESAARLADRRATLFWSPLYWLRLRVARELVRVLERTR